jgi:allophanate hydrolase subunit 1
MKRALLRDGCAALVDSIASSRDIARDSVSSAQAREHTVEYTVERSSTADMAQALRGLWTEVTAAQQADNIDHVYEACLAALEEKADAPESTDVGHAYDWHTAA